MYLVTVKAAKKKRNYLVISKTPSVVESIIENELKDIEEEISITNMKESFFDNIIDDGIGAFYNIVDELESTDGKITKESHLIRAEDHAKAVFELAKQEGLGELVLLKKTDILKILK